MLRATQTVEGQAKRRQRRTILANAIKTAFCDTVAKNVKAFCLCPKNLPTVNLKVMDLFLWQRRFQESPK